MLTLCIDTAYKYLTCALISDNKIISEISFECFKKQSEELFVCLKKVFEQVNMNPKEIDSICISEGPGSYTGTRIAMTLAKTMGEVLPCEVYTISTLRLYASARSNTMVIMNARADRAYVGIYDKNEIIVDDYVSEIKNIDIKNYNIIGDGSLVNRQDIYPNIPEAFLKTKDVWTRVDKIAFLTPKYLKESESYLK